MTPEERAAMQQAIHNINKATALDEESDDFLMEALAALRSALAESEALEQPVQEGKCNRHPDAPHGFDRNASHNADRYVCECESWSPDDMAHRAGGLSMDQKPNSMFMEGYRIGLAEMREKCAKVCEKLQNEAEAVAKCFDATAEECAAAIRAINFEGDTGFRPVSEMIAEHKQDPKKAAAIEKAKMRKTTRAEKIARPGVYEYYVGEFAEPSPAVPIGTVLVPKTEQTVSKDFETWWEQEGQEFLYALNTTTDDDIKLVAEVAWKNGAYNAEQPVSQEPRYFGLTHDHTWLSIDKKQYDKLKPEGRMACYATPVRTKDLTDDEIWDALASTGFGSSCYEDARAVIAADREKNRA